jgi:hypothetical protein
VAASPPVSPGSFGSVGSVASPVLFVVGSGRVGADGLRTLLSLHPALAMTPESWFTSQWLRPHMRRILEAGPRLDAQMLLSRLQTHRNFAEWQLPLRDVEDEWALLPPASIPAALGGIYQAYAQAAGKRLCGDVTPGYVTDVGLLATTFPRARFLHLVRDGRDAARSSQSPAEPATPEAVLAWRRQVRMARRASSAIPGRYLEVRLEDLTDAPEVVLRRICRFLDLPFAPEMLAGVPGFDVQTAGLQTWVPIQPNRRPEHDPAGEEPPRAALDAAVLDLIAGRALRDFGYPTGPTPAGTTAARAAAVTLYQRGNWQLRRAYRVGARAVTRRAESRSAALLSPPTAPRPEAVLGENAGQLSRS